MFTNLLFDLDNTLYPASAAMDANLTKRTIEQAAKHLSVSFEEAKKMRSQGVPNYGTTLEWLRKEHDYPDSKIEDYFTGVHPEYETEDLDFDPNLRDFLLSLNMPMAILTNSPIEHAERSLKFLGIADLFVSINDIKSANLMGKPHASCFQKALEKSGFQIENTLFFDDYPKYAKGYANIGGTPIVVDEHNKYADCPYLRIKTIYEIPELLKKL